MSILKTMISSQVFVANKMLATDKVGGIEDSNKLIEKCEKLSKIGKLSKFRKLAKPRKKLSKSENSPNFDAKKNKPSFLTPNANKVFNCLRLIFIEALIFQYFDPEYYIWIEIYTSAYAISGVLS